MRLLAVCWKHIIAAVSRRPAICGEVKDFDEGAVIFPKYQIYSDTQKTSIPLAKSKT
jgi:hypothetical protein